jgi:hypothetical protein
MVWLVFAVPAAAQLTDRASVSSASVQGNQDSGTPTVSADGRYVAFYSRSSDLVPGDTNGESDVFVRDRHTGTTERVSVATDGSQGNGFGSHVGAITPDGRFVVFSSYSTNLVPGDTNGRIDVFVRDRWNSTTERVSVATGGAQGDENSHDWLSISADGRYVAFMSEATTLVPGDTNGAQDIFVRDRQSGTTERVSVDSSGAQSNDACFFSFLSGNGRFVAFHSRATNLVVGDTNAAQDVFVHDRQTGITELVSVSSSGTQGNSDTTNRPSLSFDGRFVEFDSMASNLVPGDTNNASDIFLRDRLANTTVRVSVGTGGVQADGSSFFAYLSSDGRHVGFQSYATNLVPGDTNGEEDVFVHDILSGVTERASVGSIGTQGNGSSSFAAMSAGGQFVAFVSYATNLVAGDTNLSPDVFLRDRFGTGFQAFCFPGSPNVPACPCSNPPASGGLGCDNFGAGPAQSGKLGASGVASLAADSVVLLATGENNSSLTVFWQGRDPLPAVGVVHGAGVRCVSATLRRLYTGAASGGAVQRPGGGDPSVSVRSAAAGDVIAPGQNRHYFAIYRDPGAAGPCGSSGATVNLTNAGTILWGP